MTGGETGPIPAENQPGHHPPKEQDKPDLDAFAARLGTDPKSPAATTARKAPRPKATRPKTAPKPTAHVSAPQPELAEQNEPRLVGLLLLPLRETVKRLEQLDRTLSGRLTRKLSAKGGLGPKGR